MLLYNIRIAKVQIFFISSDLCQQKREKKELFYRKMGLLLVYIQINVYLSNRKVHSKQNKHI